MKKSTFRFFIIFLIGVIVFPFLKNTSANAKELVENCDVNNDWQIDIQDIASVAQKYNLKFQDSDWNNSYDINGDGIIDLYDLTFLSKNIGQDIRFGNTPSNLINSGGACIKGKWIYYSNWLTNGELCKVNIDGTERTKLSDDFAQSINVLKDWVYYLNENDWHLYKVKTDGTSHTLLSSDLITDMIAYKDLIIYTNYNDEALYSIKNDGTSRFKISNDYAAEMSIVDDWIYYINISDGRKLYKCRLDGSGRTKVSDEELYTLHAWKNGIFYISDSDNMIYRMNFDGTGKKKISNDTALEMNLSEDWIYYGNYGEDFALYKIKTDGTSRTKLTDDDSEMIQVCGNSIIYYNHQEQVMYEMDKDSTLKKVFGLDIRVDDISVTLEVGENYTLPTLVTGYFWMDNTPINLPVKWNVNTIDTSKTGTQIIKGTADHCSRTINLNISIVPFSALEFGNTAGNILNGGIFASKNGYVYYSTYTYGKPTFKVNQDTLARTQLLNESSSCINVVGDWIYFIDNTDYGFLHKMKTDGTSNVRLTNGRVHNLIVLGDNLYFISEDNGYSIMKMKKDGSGLTALISEYTNRFIIADKSIYFYTPYTYAPFNSGGVFKANIDGSGQTKVIGTPSAFYNVVGEWMYYENILDNNSLYKIKVDGTENTKLSSDYIAGLNAYDGWLYYISNDSSNRLYKIKPDGTGKQQLNDELTYNLSISDGYIYYRTPGPWETDLWGSDVYIRLNTDGTGRTILGTIK